MKKSELRNLLNRAFNMLSLDDEKIVEDDRLSLMRDLEVAEKHLRLGPYQESTKPKTINLIIDGVDTEPLVHDGRYMTLALRDEMEMRGGQSFHFHQKFYTADDAIREVARLGEHLKDPYRHPNTEYILIIKQQKRDENTPMADDPVDQILKFLKIKVPIACIKSFVFPFDVDNGYIAAVLYDALYHKLTTVPGITAPPAVNTEAVAEVRNQLLGVQNALRSVGFALNAVEQPQQTFPQQPIPGANFQGFGRTGRPFRHPPRAYALGEEEWVFAKHGVPPGFGSFGPRPFPFGLPPFRHMQTAGGYQPNVPGDYDGDEMNFGSFGQQGGWPQTIPGSHISPSADELAAALKPFDGCLVIHALGNDAALAAEEANDGYLKNLLPEAEISLYMYEIDDANLSATVKANLEKFTTPNQIHLVVLPTRPMGYRLGTSEDIQQAQRIAQQSYLFTSCITLSNLTFGVVEGAQMPYVGTVMRQLVDMMKNHAARTAPQVKPLTLEELSLLTEFNGTLLVHVVPPSKDVPFSTDGGLYQRDLKSLLPKADVVVHVYDPTDSKAAVQSCVEQVDKIGSKDQIHLITIPGGGARSPSIISSEVVQAIRGCLEAAHYPSAFLESPAMLTRDVVGRQLVSLVFSLKVSSINRNA